MNVIADRLFSLLLGWTRSLFNSLWNLVTNHSSGIAGFLERFWLPMILLLLLVGTVTDYIIWIIRWRPYYVWRSRLIRRDRDKRLAATRAYMTDLDRLPLDLGVEAPLEDPFSPMTPLEEAVTFPEGDGFPYPSQQAPYAQPQPAWQPEPQPEALFSAPVYPEPQPDPELPFAAWTAQPQEPWQEEAEIAPAWDEPFPSAEPAEEPLEEARAETAPSRRRRRSQTKRQRQPGFLRALRETLIDPADPDEQLDSLPPPISQEDAFHQPFYPENYRYRPGPREGDDSST